MITQDLPTFLKSVRARRMENSRTPSPIWIGHSWGGVLILAMLARFPEFLPEISKIVLFGCKRTVRVQNPEKWLKIDLIWKCLAPLLSAYYGYLPGRQWKLGSDQETKLSHAHSRRWVISSQWIDPVDGFNYGEAIRKLKLPPILSVVGEHDHALGHLKDVKRFLDEAGAQDAETLQMPFGHIDVLSSARAREDVFPKVVNWLKSDVAH